MQNLPIGKSKRRSPRPKIPSGYVLFMNKTRPDIANLNPDLSFGEISKRVASAWKDLPKSEKNVRFDLTLIFLLLLI
jgi:hypothetical protein